MVRASRTGGSKCLEFPAPGSLSPMRRSADCCSRESSPNMDLYAQGIAFGSCYLFSLLYLFSPFLGLVSDLNPNKLSIAWQKTTVTTRSRSL